ncbi:hypothetical protein [uncultured Brevundimonas sp.]|uniref:hypothetical protein n=1 Tax=uncultured Brevundimonas sp. TaxID=213418 RepID=UPI0025F995B4|nr:hypothetical protein [uncultured Brevundimonas sp.]
MRLLHTMVAHAALICLAAAADAGSEADAKPISAPLDGQIALTAYNNGDGTWSVRRGPDGPVLKDGLPREEALAIVGAPTGPYEPATEVEAVAAEKRSEIEQAEVVREEAEVFKSDEEVGDPAKVANQAHAAEVERANAENADLRRSIASKDEEIRQLREQVAKFDGDNDGKTGGSTKKADAKTEGSLASGGEGKAKNGGE